MFDDCTRANCVVIRHLLTHKENWQVFKWMCGFLEHIYESWISVCKPDPENQNFVLCIHITTNKFKS